MNFGGASRSVGLLRDDATVEDVTDAALRLEAVPLGLEGVVDHRVDQRLVAVDVKLLDVGSKHEPIPQLRDG